MILFLQSRRDLKEYFSGLIEQTGLTGKIYNPKTSILPDASAFLSPPKSLLADAVEHKLIDKNSRSEKPVGALKVLGYRLSARFLYACDVAYLKKHSAQLAVVWNGLKFRQALFVGAAKKVGIPCCFMENGLLPNTTVCDSKGVNAGNSLPRDPDFYSGLNDIQPFVQERLTVRAQVTEKLAGEAKIPDKYIFVPFQVDSDSQIVSYSPWIKSMEQLAEACIAALPVSSDIKLVFKEHPSSYVNYDYLHNKIDREKALFANDANTQALIEGAEAVITINSTVGIESLAYGKRVITLGDACYNINGLVAHADNENDLSQILTELINGDLEFNADLRARFLAYLQHGYHVTGDWRKPDTDHYQSLAARLESFL